MYHLNNFLFRIITIIIKQINKIFKLYMYFSLYQHIVVRARNTQTKKN